MVLDQTVPFAAPARPARIDLDGRESLPVAGRKAQEGGLRSKNLGQGCGVGENLQSRTQGRRSVVSHRPVQAIGLALGAHQHASLGEQALQLGPNVRVARRAAGANHAAGQTLDDLGVQIRIVGEAGDITHTAIGKASLEHQGALRLQPQRLDDVRGGSIKKDFLDVKQAHHSRGGRGLRASSRTRRRARGEKQRRPVTGAAGSERQSREIAPLERYFDAALEVAVERKKVYGATQTVSEEQLLLAADGYQVELDGINDGLGGTVAFNLADAHDMFQHTAQDGLATCRGATRQAKDVDGARVALGCVNPRTHGPLELEALDDDSRLERRHHQTLVDAAPELDPAHGEHQRALSELSRQGPTAHTALERLTHRCHCRIVQGDLETQLRVKEVGRQSRQQAHCVIARRGCHPRSDDEHHAVLEACLRERELRAFENNPGIVIRRWQVDVDD